MKAKRKKNYMIASVLALILLMAMAACGQANVNTTEAPETDGVVEEQIVEASDSVAVEEIETPSTDDDSVLAVSNPAVSGELSEEEIEGLVFMREEEKLARDVYLTLSDVWGLPVFSNIALSEATHMEAVLSLINRYGIEDPAAITSIGEFTDPTLQGLFDQLVATGGQSLADALRVGAAIEEIDILDLEKHLAQTSREDIIFVYNNLMKGSRNHLGAFVQNLERRTGEVYQPQYLDQDAYAAIIDGSTESGGWGNGGGRGFGKGGNPNRGNP